MRVRRALLLLANLAAAVLLQPAGAETAPPSTLPSFRTLGASLTYGLLSPPASEWNATFRAPGTGRAHVWLRCLDWTVRAYYFFEAADAPAGALLGRQTVSALASRQQGGEDGVTGVAWPGVFTVDGWPVVAYNTQHGGEWYAPVPRHAPLDGTLAVSVAGWSTFFEFPLAGCGSQPARPRPSRVSVLSYTLDVSDGSLAHGGDADGGTAAMAGLVWRHAAYHGCALGAGYTLLLQRRFAAPLLRADPRLRALVDAGALEMVLKPVMPALSVGRTLKWQALYGNLALLEAWGGPSVLLQIDLDEYVNVSAARKPELMRLLLSSAQVRLPRWSVHCASACGAAGAGELWRTPFAGRSWRREPDLWGSSKFSLKSAFDPDHVYGVAPHYALVMGPDQRRHLGGGALRTEVRKMPLPHLATVVHVRSMVTPRWEPPPEAQAGMEDAGLGPMHACDPLSAAAER